MTSIKRGIVARSTGNWRNVTTSRVRPQASGITPDEGATVVKMTETSVDVMLSAGATIAWEVLENAHGKVIADEIIGAAIQSAQARGCKRVWDIDCAFAVGFPVTPEGAQAFRTKYGLRKPSRDWPMKPEETPDPSYTGTVIDVETGMIV